MQLGLKPLENKLPNKQTNNLLYARLLSRLSERLRGSSTYVAQNQLCQIRKKDFKCLFSEEKCLTWKEILSVYFGIKSAYMVLKVSKVFIIRKLK